MKVAKEVKIGLVVTAAIAFFIYGFNFLKGSNIFSSQRIFYGIYSDIGGLVKTNPVIVNGLKVGQVKETKLMPDNRILVSMLILEPELDVPVNSVAKIISADLLGGKTIELELGNSSVYLKNRDTIPTGIDKPITEAFSEMVEPIKNKAEHLFMSIDTVITVVQAILNEDARKDITGSFERLHTAIYNVERTTLKLDELMAEEKLRLSKIFRNVESISGNLAANNSKITAIMNNMEQITDTARTQLVPAFTTARRSLDSFSCAMDKISRGEGTIGNLLHNDSLYNNLESSSRHLDSLLIDLQANPRRYVHFSIFGGGGKKHK